jgi:hypothetical protein
MSRKIDNEPFINEDLMDRVDWIVDDVILHDDTWKKWEHDIEKQEEMHLSELYRMLENFTKTDLAVATIVAMENYPFMVLQIVAEYIINKEEKK